MVWTSDRRRNHRFHAKGERKLMLDRLFRRDRGQGLVEYALIIALVAVVVIGILILLGPAIGSIFSNIKNNL
jgi:pilus assembly protein Flp/PilA